MAWWTSPSGKTCVQALNAIGASSFAASKVDLSGSGNDASDGAAVPTWAYGTGWTGNGTTQYLLSGLTPAASGWSMIVRFILATTKAVGPAGSFNAAAPTNRFYARPKEIAVDQARYSAGSTTVTVATGFTSGTIGIAGLQGYRNGVADGAPCVIGVDAQLPIYICGENAGGSLVGFPGSVQAIALYSQTLTAADMAAIHTAMMALPVALGLPVIAQWHAEMFD